MRTRWESLPTPSRRSPQKPRPLPSAKSWSGISLKTVFDPEIPVNVVDLGLVYCLPDHARRNRRPQNRDQDVHDRAGVRHGGRASRRYRTQAIAACPRSGKFTPKSSSIRLGIPAACRTPPNCNWDSISIPARPFPSTVEFLRNGFPMAAVLHGLFATDLSDLSSGKSASTASAARGRSS